MPAYKDMKRKELLDIVEKQSNELKKSKRLVWQVNDIKKSWSTESANVTKALTNLQNAINLTNTHKGDYSDLKKKVNVFLYGDENDSNNVGVIKKIEQIENFWEGEEQDGEEIVGMKDRIDNLWNRISDDWEGEKEGTERKGGLRERVEKLRNEIETFWKGAKDEEGEISKGYKDKIETWNEDMHIKIEDLLSSATNVSLGRGYQEQLDKHEENANRYGKYFKWCLIIFIIIFSSLLIYILFVANVGSVYISSLIENKLYYIILPISATLLGLVIWLGTFIKDKEKEERILHAEYSHKKRFIDFFVGYMHDIEKLDVEDIVDTQSALTKLYNEMIASAGHNPSLRIQQKGSDHFIQAIADKVSSKETTVKPLNEKAIKELIKEEINNSKVKT